MTHEYLIHVVVTGVGERLESSVPAEVFSEC